jgi:KDO2-lipid IV(A) lauroyltransferase
MLNYILYRIAQFIALSLPLNLGYFIAVVFSDLHYFFAFRDRRIIAENLKAIFPQKSEKEIRRMRIRLFRNFAKYLVDFFRFSKLDKDYINKHFKVEGIHHFDEELAKGKGVVVLTAHIGNWELGGVVIALLGYPFWVVALAHKHKKVDKFFNHQRNSKGIRVIPVGKAGRMCLNVLKDNQMVALLGDRDFSKSGIPVNFFGRKTIFPIGPAFLSLKTGASIVPGFMIRNKDDSFTLKIEKAIQITKGENREEDLARIINEYKIVIEEYIRKYPDQWYMFQRFWV